MKNIILFDIDYTLINTDILRRRFQQNLIKTIGTNQTDFLKVRLVYQNSLKSSTDFNPDTYCRFLSKHYGVDYQQFIVIYYGNINIYKNILYPDTISTLEKLKDKYILGIYSEGYKKFQKAKLKYSGIIPYFDKKYLYIKRRKTGAASINGLPTNCIIIDDNQKVAQTLTGLGFNVIWLNRKSKISLTNTKTAFNLKELRVMLI